jgi:hypothetical protein
MRYRLLLAAWFCLSLSGSASAHTSVGGGGTPEDPNADCLRWEQVPAGAADAALPDAGGQADAGHPDGGSPAVTLVLRCAEHATMFGCACTLARPDASLLATAAALSMAALATLLATRRRAKRARPRKEGR